MCNWVQKDAAQLLHVSPRVINYKIEDPRDQDAWRGRGACQRRRTES